MRKKEQKWSKTERRKKDDARLSLAHKAHSCLLYNIILSL